MQELVRSIYTEGIQAQIAAGESLPEALEMAAMVSVDTLLTDHKIIVCGARSCSMLANHFAQLLVNFYETERPCLPALVLAAETVHLGHDQTEQHHEHFARQIRAIAQPGDVLLALSLNGQEKSVVSAVEAALTRDMKVIAMMGDEGGELSGLLGPVDVEVRVPSKRPSRILEAHLFNLHCLVQLIELTLFPHQQ